MPGLNTSALPDLIFTVLFFFMIVTHMRDVELKVRYEVPQGKELTKLEHKGAAVNIYIGKEPTTGEYRLQLNNEIASLEKVKTFIEQERALMNEDDRERMTVNIKADKDVPMGMIIDLKKELQAAFALRINYGASPNPSKGGEPDGRR